MRYQVSLEGRTREVEVRILPDGRVSVAVDGAPVAVEVSRVPGGVTLRAGDRVFDVAVGGAGREKTLAAGDRRGVAEVVDERTARRAERARAAGGGGLEVRSPMPGRVVKVLVAPGDTVAAGAPVVVVEAMKMQNELRSPVDGTVTEVRATEGATVEGGAVLVRFAPAEPS